MLQHAQGVELRYVRRCDKDLSDAVAPNEVWKVVNMAKHMKAADHFSADRRIGIHVPHDADALFRCPVNVPFEDLTFMSGPNHDGSMNKKTGTVASPQNKANQEPADDHQHGPEQPGQQ